MATDVTVTPSGNWPGRRGRIARWVDIAGSHAAVEILDRIVTRAPFARMGYIARNSYALMIAMVKEHVGWVAAEVNGKERSTVDDGVRVVDAERRQRRRQLTPGRG